MQAGKKIINILFKGCQVNPISRINLQKAIIKALNEFPDQINILFASNGGEIKDGLDFYKVFKGMPSPIPICIYNIGSVGSAGTMIFLSFDNRYFLPTKSKFLIHAVRLKEGVVPTEENERERLEYNEKMINVYNENISLPNIHISKMKSSLDDIPIEKHKDIVDYKIAELSNIKFSPPFITVNCEVVEE